MPDYTFSEITINANEEKQEKILKKILNEYKNVDFEILLPIPLNCWNYNLGAVAREISPYNWLDWCPVNWGTKGNAFEFENIEQIKQEKYKIIITIKTAWNAPFGWIIALYNYFKHEMTVKVFNYTGD